MSPVTSTPVGRKGSGGSGARAWVGLTVASAARAQSCPATPKCLRCRTKQTRGLTALCPWRVTTVCSEGRGRPGHRKACRREDSAR